MRGLVRLCAAAAILASAIPARAAPDSYPLDKVRRGQTGYGMATFHGTKPERFTFEVVSVVRNFLPKQDIILIKSDDPKLAVSGFWQGSSGSPLYLDDKLLCAFSYGFRFNKIAMGGCTPIEYMKRDGDAPRRRPTVLLGGGKLTAPAAESASMADWRRLTPAVDVPAALAALGPARRSWLLSAPLPEPLPQPEPVDGQLMAASVPLTVAGFSAPAFHAISRMFAGSALVPVRAGGTGAAVAPGGRSEAGPREFVMGGPIAVELIRGDMAAAAVGTVSMLDGNKVLAFGHPMFQGGEFYAPVSTVNVHTVVPSAQSAFVIGSALNEIGSLVHDRQAAIIADLGMRTPTIPIAITVVAGAGKRVETGRFNVEILASKFLTPQLAGAAVMNAIQHYLPDRDHVTARIDSAIHLRGHDPLTFVDYMYANDGAGSVMGAVRGLRVLAPLLLNPYAPVQIERVDLKVDLRFEASYGEIRELRVPEAELVAGQRNYVEVRLTTWNGTDVIERVPVDVPRALAGSIVQLEVTAGDNAKLDAATPVDLPSLLAAFRKLLPGTVWAVTLTPADDGASVDGKLVRDLSPSAADKLRPQSRTQRVAPYKPIGRTLATATRVIEGSQSMLVRVR
jgi:hypothetical protein